MKVLTRRVKRDLETLLIGSREWRTRFGGARKVRNVRREGKHRGERRDEWLPRYVTRARDVTGPVTRAPCAPGHVSCHALASIPAPFTSLRRAPTCLLTDCIPLPPVSLHLLFCSLLFPSTVLDHSLRASNFLSSLAINCYHYHRY